MYLKSIEVHGFKSFANKIVFDFHKGITGIVGPNGSGKSNVADAVRWVLGEQSVKQLRGASMQDVIFAGTENRKPLSYAYVAITLDNSDHQLAIDFEEVTVARRLYRSGESEYLINGNPCRLKEVSELFYDTGIGKEGYSIIGQGQIDRILSGKPEERRELFDEAAGIVKFKKRKATAQKKLENERDNLVRVNDILAELERQVGPLERQSEKAKTYLKKKGELKEYDVNMYLLESKQIESQQKEVEEKYKIADEQLKESNADYEKIRKEYEQLGQSMAEMDEKINSIRENISNTSVMKEKLESQIQILTEQIHTAEMTDEHLQSRLDAIEKEKTERTEARATYASEKEKLDEQLAEVQKRQDEAQAKLTEVQQEITRCNQGIENGQKELYELLNNKAGIQSKQQRFDTMLEQINIRKAELGKRLLDRKTQEADLNSVLADYQKDLESVSLEIIELKKKEEELTQKEKEWRHKLCENGQKLEENQTAFHKQQSRLESLKNIAERYDGYGNSIRKVMEQKTSNPGLLGVVSDLIQVEKKYETAIETALGGNIQNIVTEDESTAKKMIGFLKQNRLGRATFLPLTSVSAKGNPKNETLLDEEGVLGIANRLVKCDKKYDEVAAYLLGRVLVVDTIDHAIALAKKNHYSLHIVTLEGEDLSPGGSMTGGAFKNNSNLLGRRREIEELEKKVKELASRYNEIRQSMEDNRRKRNEMRDIVSSLQQKFQEQSIGQNTARMNIEQLEKKAEEIRGSYVRIQREEEEIRRQTREMQADNAQITQELETSKKDEEELETFIETRQKELEDWKKDEAQTLETLEKIRLDASASQQKESFIKENLKRLKEEIGVLSKEKEEILDSLEKVSQETAEKRKTIKNVQAEIESFAAKEEASQKQLEKLQQEKEESTKSHKEFFEKRDELSNQISLLDKECFRLKTQAEKIEENREARISYMWEEYEITPNNALQYRKEEFSDRHVMKQQIHKLKDEIRALGSVNVNAIEDYKELLERHTFLNGQYNDLLEAEKTLEQIIQELDEGMRKQFTEKFGEIQKEFDKAFKELFGGGRGTLELAEDEDILEAGIKIISQPPGKKLQNMMQLSGGEKALTAIALLFAIQNLKPSPFCLLDEIEAALDDSNVGRFAGYLQKLTKNTQFIIITHRRGTMNAADRLYGITMQEKGVSTLVSVDLVENQLTR